MSTVEIPNDKLFMNNTKITLYLRSLIATVENLPINEIIQVIDILENTRRTGKKVVIFGNGGSAATASHLACDLSKGANVKGKPRMKVFTLTDNIALLTAWANDNMYRNAFAEQVENLVEAEDVIIAISASGNSWNVVNGVKAAIAKAAVTIGLLGFDGGELGKIVDIPIRVPVDDMEQIEDIHLVIAHLIKTCLRGAK